MCRASGHQRMALFIITFQLWNHFFSCAPATCYIQCDGLLLPLTACLLCLQEHTSRPLLLLLSAQDSLSQVLSCCSSQEHHPDSSDSRLTVCWCFFFNRSRRLKCQTPGCKVCKEATFYIKYFLLYLKYLFIF